MVALLRNAAGQSLASDCQGNSDASLPLFRRATDFSGDPRKPFFELYFGSDNQVETCGYERLVDLGEARKLRHETRIRDEHKHFVWFAIGATLDQHSNVQRGV